MRNSLYSDKVVVITGSTQGLGEAIARKMVAEQAAGVSISGRNVERGKALAEELTGLGTPTIFVRTELENPDECRNLIRQSVEHFGRLDGLVNSAGITTRGTLEESSVELWDHHMAVNARAPFLTMQESVIIMQKQGWGGSIVNIITKSAHGGQPFLTPYSSSKGALATLTKNAAYSQRWHKIRVNGIMVGWMDTPAEDAIQREAHGAESDWLETAESQSPMGKLAKPDEIAELVVLLLSERGGVMTGSLIDYDQEIVGASD